MHKTNTVTRLCKKVNKSVQNSTITYHVLNLFSHAAVSYGHADLIEFLLSSGADLNLRDIDGDTPLLVCEEPEIFELLIQHGANAEDVNSEGEGILEKALQDENENLIAFLIVNQYISNDEVQNMIKNNTVDQTAEQLCGIDEEDEEDESHKSID